MGLCRVYGWNSEKEEVDYKIIDFAWPPTQDIINQARKQNCDMIVSHHPLFYVPASWSEIDIYSAHTNLDRAQGGTTDTIIKTLELQDSQINLEHDFLRFVDLEISVEEFAKKTFQNLTKFTLYKQQFRNNSETHRILCRKRLGIY